MSSQMSGTSVADFGATGDGTTDDTAAIQRAIDGMAESGGTVWLPPGQYRITSLNVPTGVSLQGTYTFSSPGGSWLHCVGRDAPALTLHSGNSLQGLAFFYPEQHWDHDAEAPAVAYPPSISLAEGANRTAIRDVFFANTYEAIDADRHHEYLVLQNVQGYAIYRGIVEDHSTDIDRWTTVHFNMNCMWVVGEPDDAKFAAWTRRHGTAFTLRRADWLVMIDCFAWGYRTGLKLEQSPAGHGAPFGVHVIACGFDACGVCIHMTSGFGARITDTFFVSHNAWEPGVETDPAAVIAEGGGEISLKSCRWWGCDHGAVHLACSNSIVDGNGFIDYGQRGAEEQRAYPAVTVGRGIHQISGNQFFGVYQAESSERITGNSGVRVLADVSGAVITGNLFSDLDGGSIHVEGTTDTMIVQANLHQGSSPELAVGGQPGDSPADLTLP